MYNLKLHQPTSQKASSSSFRFYAVLLCVFLCTLLLFFVVRLTNENKHLLTRLELLNERPNEIFCPPDLLHSTFLSASDVVHLDPETAMCVDAILYGYDLLFEQVIADTKQRLEGRSYKP